MSYRPEGWENPYIEYVDGLPVVQPYSTVAFAFEAGADAMLETLKKEGVHFTEHIELSGNYMNGIFKHVNYVPGTMIFIPDEE